jgi:hypothetical protein
MRDGYKAKGYMDCKIMCDLRIWGRRATYRYTYYRLSVYLLTDEKLSVWVHTWMEKTAVQFARALASGYNITSLH